MSDGDVIVLGMDGSPGAQAALDEVIRLARGTSAHVLVTFGYRAVRMAGETKDLEDAVEGIGQTAGGAAVAALSAAGIACELVLVHARPADALIETAAERGGTLIAVGSRGEGLLKGAVLGSVTYQIVHRSTVPVLVCPVRS